MKAKYKATHQKLEIHKVDCNRRIVLKEVDVEEFAVKLTMSNPKPSMKTFRGEADRKFIQLEGRRGSDIRMSDLVDKKNRVTFVTAIAGSGKSVLVKQLTYKWANGELFNNFKVCITFECRELNYFALNEGKKYKEHELVEFIKSHFHFDVKDSHNALFIVDGLDELYDVKSNDSIISQLLDLKKSKFIESKIIITGRTHIEDKLFRHGKNMGGLRKVEIIGLSDEQIDEYICKFASSDEEIANIKKVKEFSKTSMKFLSVPQMLSSFCCVSLLSDETIINNAAELYCWSFYLLLRQNADKDGSRDNKNIPDIFKEYSKDLLLLSEICHDLLNKNSIIFDGTIELQFVNIGKGKEFLSSLFVDVSDDFTERKQFNHLTLMEFLSAIYACTSQNRTEIIMNILKMRSYQVLFFYCQLMSGLMYDGIIKHLFTDASKLEESDAKIFFATC